MKNYTLKQAVRLWKSKAEEAEKKLHIDTIMQKLSENRLQKDQQLS